MQIVIDHQNIRDSQIVKKDISPEKVEVLPVEVLPLELQRRMLNLLEELKQKSVNEINVRENVLDSLLKVDRFWIAIPGFLDQDIKKMFLETIELLVWYMNPHWYTPDDPKTLSSFFCTDCTTMSRSIQITKHCEFPECPSHGKWRMVIGPSYTPPPQEEKAN